MQLIEVRKGILGEKHLVQFTLISMTNLADTWESQGRLRPCRFDVDMLLTPTAGPRPRSFRYHSDTAYTLSRLAKWQESVGRMETEETSKGLEQH